MRVVGTSAGRGSLWALLVGCWVLIAAGPAGAQFFGGGGDAPRPPGDVPGQAPTTTQSLLPPSQAPSGRGDRPLTSSPGPTLQSLPPASTNPVPGPTQVLPAVPAGQAVLALAARFGRDMPSITGGLIWRVYGGKPDQGGAFRLIKEDKNASPVLTLPPGAYVVHAGFGLASSVRAIQLRAGETAREGFEISAGGLRIEGKVGDARIPAGQISFDIYTGSQFDPKDKRPIAQSVMTGDLVLMPEGIYHIVSNYGDANSVVRSDIRVQASKLTDATVTHRAAIITLKLVNDRGGEALANTQWTVITPGGDVIKDSINGAFPRVILAEGDYRAIARNENKTYQRDFKVITGVDGEVEVLTH